MKVGSTYLTVYTHKVDPYNRTYTQILIGAVRLPWQTPQVWNTATGDIWGKPSRILVWYAKLSNGSFQWQFRIQTHCQLITTASVNTVNTIRAPNCGTQVNIVMRYSQHPVKGRSTTETDHRTRKRGPSNILSYYNYTVAGKTCPLSQMFISVPCTEYLWIICTHTHTHTHSRK
jgi:hypothetical protein